jgi:hypothetical protein
MTSRSSLAAHNVASLSLCSAPFPDTRRTRMLHAGPRWPRPKVCFEASVNRLHESLLTFARTTPTSSCLLPKRASRHAPQGRSCYRRPAEFKFHRRAASPASAGADESVKICRILHAEDREYPDLITFGSWSFRRHWRPGNSKIAYLIVTTASVKSYSWEWL